MKVYIAYYSNCYSSDVKVFGLYKSIEDARNVLMKDIKSAFEEEVDMEIVLKELIDYNCYDNSDSEMTWKIEKRRIV